VPPQKQPPVKPIVILIVCVCVVAMMFIGSILIATLAVQSERQQPAAEQSDGP
jgi:hypothetical protein